VRESTLIYDCEIVRAIPPNGNTPRLEGVEYCGGWGDYAGMGISVACAWDLWEDRPYVFMQCGFRDFLLLCEKHERLVTFNGHAFDEPLCKAHAIPLQHSYDLLVEVRLASGQPATFTPGRTRGGYTLGALAEANLGVGKCGDGASAPILWQQGKRSEVINYCLQDVLLTRDLYLMRKRIADPTRAMWLTLRD
jgi:hypothetical protein